MGTNYYFKKGDELLHIGKSSSGWSFSFRGYRGLGIKSEKDWENMFSKNPDGKIIDEYGREVTKKNFWNLVESKRDGKNHAAECLREDNELNRNNAISHCWFDDETGSSFCDIDFS